MRDEVRLAERSSLDLCPIRGSTGVRLTPTRSASIQHVVRGQHRACEKPKLRSHKILSIPIPAERRRIKASASSWVEHFRHAGQGYFLKTYVYQAPFGPLKGAFRNTFLAPSRVEREWRALGRLAASGLQPDLRVDHEEERLFGFLLRARLLTRDFGGEDLARLLAARVLERAEITALARFIRSLHESGLRDPDLLARNILAIRSSDRISFAKIDSSSARFLTPGSGWDGRRSRDLATLIADLASRKQPGLLRLLVLQWFPEPRPLGRRVTRRLLAAARGEA